MAYQLHTWAEIRERLFDRVERKPFWEPEELQDAFNEGLYLWNLCTGWWQQRVTLTTTAGTYFYTLPSTILYRTRAEFNGYSLLPTNHTDLNLSRYNWRTETTTSGGGVPTRPAVWAPISLQTFYIWPADAVGGNTLLFDGVAATPVLTEDGDFLDLGEEQLDILLGYAVHMLAFKKGGPYFQTTLGLFRDFLVAAAEENGQIKTTEIFRRVTGRDDRGYHRERGGPENLTAILGPNR